MSGVKSFALFFLVFTQMAMAMNVMIATTTKQATPIKM